MSEQHTIQCGKHKGRPSSIVCIHLFKDPTLEWVPMIQNEESQYYDYLCPECTDDYDRMIKEMDVTKLKIACVNCVDAIRRVFDKNYEAASSDAQTVQDLPFQRQIPIRESKRDADSFST